MTGNDVSGQVETLHGWTEAEIFLGRIEPRFVPLIKQFGPCPLTSMKGHEEDSVFVSLLGAILSQQISTKAAESIKKRLYAHFPESDHPPADLLMSMDDDAFRTLGISRQKAGYIRDLASKCELIPKSSELDAMEDEVIIQALTTVRGIGRWSVEMMLMFHLGRPDVFAADDLGLQEGIKRLLDLSERPKRKEMPALAEAWRPYRSTASWYLWRLL